MHVGCERHLDEPHNLWRGVLGGGTVTVDQHGPEWLREHGNTTLVGMSVSALVSLCAKAGVDIADATITGHFTLTDEGRRRYNPQRGHYLADLCECGLPQGNHRC